MALIIIVVLAVFAIVWMAFDFGSPQSKEKRRQRRLDRERRARLFPDEAKPSRFGPRWLWPLILASFGWTVTQPAGCPLDPDILELTSEQFLIKLVVALFWFGVTWLVIVIAGAVKKRLR